MKSKIKYIFSLIFLFIGLFLTGKVNFVLAQYGVPPYGEVPPIIKIWVDKKVWNPEATKGSLDEFVDNLGPSKYHFSPGEEVTFLIVVENTGETTFEKVRVKDILPPYVEHVSGPTEIEYQDLGPDETRTFEIEVQVVPADQLPDDSEPYCVLNKVTVAADGQTDEDTAQLCFKKKVLGAVVQPEAGADILVLGLGLLGLSILGLIMEKNRDVLKVSKSH